MHKLLKLILVPFMVIPTGCVYFPHTADIPLIHEKNELRVDAGVSGAVSANATVSYGLTDKIAVQAFADVGDGYYFQGAAGRYKPWQEHYVTELYAGFGYGSSDAYRDSHPGRLYGNYQLYYTQANFGRINYEFANMDLGFGLKAGLLHYNLTDHNYYYFENVGFGPYGQTYHGNGLLLEPQLMVRLGGERLKFTLKLGGSHIFDFSNDDIYLPYSRFNAGIGINYRF